MNTLPPHLRPRGRGAVSNVSGRYEAHARELADDGWGVHEDEVRQLDTELRPFAARSVLTYNTSPDLGFDRTVNPYKGCEHGCFYCYARPRHAYLGLSPGLDFETKIFFKADAPALLAKALDKPGYRPAPIVIGADTDAYQPAERRLLITRGVLETLLAYRHPAAIVTKGALVARDVDVLAEMAKLDLIKIAVSVTSLDHRLARQMEPRASTPERRLEAIRVLSDAGVPTAISTAPLIPGLNDHEMEAILERGRDAGAREAFYTVLRLPLEVADIAKEWLAANRPAAAKRVMSLVHDVREGRDNDPEFGSRMVGTGTYAELVAQRFAAATRRLGLGVRTYALRTDLFRRPARDGQLGLFDTDARAEARQPMETMDDQA